MLDQRNALCGIAGKMDWHAPLSEGLDNLRRIITDAPLWLNSGGWLLLEHGYDQGAAVRDLLKRVGLDSCLPAATWRVASV